MLPGYNHNVKYREVVYHVQTEDSGVDTPHIITHLFIGGNIIASKKTSYADMVKNGDLNEILAQLMQDQHKTMLKGLIHGRFDDEISTRSAGARRLDGPAPLNVDAGAQGRTSFGLPQGARPAATAAVTAAPDPWALIDPSTKVIEAAALQAAFESKDDKAVDSIFGNLISEKSLDEVIREFLAAER